MEEEEKEKEEEMEKGQEEEGKEGDARLLMSTCLDRVLRLRVRSISDISTMFPSSQT